MPEPSAFEFDMVNEKLKRHKLIYRITAELIKSDSRTIRSENRKLITSSWNKEELPEEWKESIVVPSYRRAIKQIIVSIGAYQICQLRIKFYPTSCSQG